MFLQKNPNQILLRIILSERAFFCKQLSSGILLQFSQKLFVFPNLCIYMHIFKPRTRFTTSNEVVYLNPDLHWACLHGCTTFRRKSFRRYDFWSHTTFCRCDIRLSPTLSQKIARYDIPSKWSNQLFYNK